MAKYQKYAEYKDSGIEWLGEIPSHWDVWKLNHFAPIITCGVAATPEYQDEGIPFLSAQNVKKKKVDLSKGYKHISQEKHNELTRNRKPQKGDILLSRVGTIGEGCIIDVDFEFSIFVSLTHLRLIQQVCINEFFIYLTESSYVKALHGAVTLVGGGVGNLNVNDLREYLLPIPQLSEQKSIVNFLDHETAKIDSLITKQEKLIELLKEKRQAVISHAVTKGLNPDVAMKDSGVEWLGQVPEHWATTKLKFVVKQIVDAEHKTAPYFEDGKYLVCRTTNVRDGKLRLEGGKYTNHQTYIEWTQRATPEIGDILFTREAPAGEACVYDGSIPLCLGQRMVLFKLDKKIILPDFLLYSIYSGLADDFIKQLSQGSTVTHFNMADIQNIPLFELPIDEQGQIVQYIKSKLNEFQKLEDRANKAIQLMQERRTALISSAVTGKIDVTNWQNPNHNNNEANTELGA